MKKISFVVPVYNEAAAIPKTVLSLRDKFPKAEIIVSDDGSSDGTAHICKSLGVVFLRHRHIGYGAAVCSGIRAARGDLLVVADADLPFSLKELKAMLEKQANYSAIICCRAGYGLIRNGFFRAMRHRLYNIVVGRFLSINIGDINGIKIIVRNELAGITMRGTGWIFGAELVYKLKRKYKKVLKYSITFHRQKYNKSHLTIRSIFVLFAELLKLRAGRI